MYNLKSQTWGTVGSGLFFGYLAWSHDSAYINFDTVSSKDSGYCRLRVGDLKMEKIVDLKKARLFPPNSGRMRGRVWAREMCRGSRETSVHRKSTHSTCSFRSMSPINPERVDASRGHRHSTNMQSPYE